MCFGGLSSQCGQTMGMPMWLPYLRAVYKLCEPGGKQPRRKVELKRHALAKSLESAEGKGEGGFGDTICSKVGFFAVVSVAVAEGELLRGCLGWAFTSCSFSRRLICVLFSQMQGEAALGRSMKLAVRTRKTSASL